MYTLGDGVRNIFALICKPYLPAVKLQPKQNSKAVWPQHVLEHHSSTAMKAILFLGLTKLRSSWALPRSSKCLHSKDGQLSHNCSTLQPKKKWKTNVCFAYASRGKILSDTVQILSFLACPWPFKTQRGTVTCFWLHRVEGCSDLRSRKQNTKYKKNACHIRPITGQE